MPTTAPLSGFVEVLGYFEVVAHLAETLHGLGSETVIAAWDFEVGESTFEICDVLSGAS